MKIKVVKEQKENGSLVYKDLKECVRKLEGYLKHQRMFGCGLKFIIHIQIESSVEVVSSVELQSTLLRVSGVVGMQAIGGCDADSQSQTWHG